MTWIFSRLCGYYGQSAAKPLSPAAGYEERSQTKWKWVERLPLCLRYSRSLWETKGVSTLLEI